MTQDARRQALIVAAFLFIALIAISPLLIRPQRSDPNPVQAGFPIKVNPFNHDSGNTHPR